MVPFGRILGSLVSSVIGIVVMVMLATIVFFITTFVVSVGSNLAGYDPSGDFVVLAAALVVVAVILTGGLTPGMAISGNETPGPSPRDNPTYE